MLTYERRVTVYDGQHPRSDLKVINLSSETQAHLREEQEHLIIFQSCGVEQWRSDKQKAMELGSTICA
jgi:hypothetical protein